MRLIVFACLFLFCHTTLSQEIDISGVWRGTTQIPQGELSAEFTFIQNGSFITGTVKQQGAKAKDSSAYVFNGTLAGTRLSLVGLKYLYKSSLLNCLPKMELTVNPNSNQPKLTGKWKSNLALGGCPPLISGKIILSQVAKNQRANNTQPPVAESTATRTPAGITADDWVGKAVVSKLQTSKYFGVIIGIDDYKSEDIESLNHPVSDATALATTLEKDYHFKSDNLYLLKNPSRAVLIETFDKLSQEVTAQDNLLIFYAGHGIWDEKLQQGYWLPSDASLKSKAQWLSNSTLRDYVGGINSKHSLLITDACFSGSILKERAVVYAESKAILEMYKLPSRKVITSGTLKTVPDKSVFFQYLLKNLQNNEAKLLSAETLFRNFKIAVVNNSPSGQVPQYGAISQTGDEGGEFIFLRK